MADNIALANNAMNPVEKKPIIKGKLDISNLELTDLNKYLAQYSAAELSRVLHLICAGNKLASINLVNLPKLRTLNCDNNEITSMTINAPSLVKLWCNYNAITTTENVNTPKLRELYCGSNDISAATNINIPSLEILDCSFNQIEIFDINAPNLRELICENCGIKSITAVMPNIRKISCDSNSITVFDHNEYNFLEELYCVDNLLETFGGKFPNLRILDCQSNKITAINIINDKLEELHCGHNNLSSVDSFKNLLKSIVKFYCYSNEIDKLNVDMPNLINLDISGNKLTELFLSDENVLANENLLYTYAPNIKNLTADTNDIHTINIKSKTLANMSCCVACITSVTINADNLTNLDLVNNEITSLSNIHAPSLKRLNVIKNRIIHFADGNVPVEFPNLTLLNINNNMLSSLHGIYAPNLELLFCFENKLESFEFDPRNNNFGKLQRILCNNHNLTTLTHLMDMPALKILRISTNKHITAAYIRSFRSNYVGQNKHKLQISIIDNAADDPPLDPQINPDANVNPAD